MNEQKDWLGRGWAYPVQIDGTTGVLAFDIKEGPQAQITNVTWAGVNDARLPAVRKAADLAVPGPDVLAPVAERYGIEVVGPPLRILRGETEGT